MILKTVINNWYIEKEIAELCSGLSNCQTNDDIRKYIVRFVKGKLSISISTFSLISLIAPDYITDINRINKDIKYVGFFNETYYLNRFLPSFSEIEEYENLPWWIIEKSKEVWSRSVSHILFFYIFFKTKELLSNDNFNNSKQEISEKSENITETKPKPKLDGVTDNLNIIHIEKKDFVLIEISKILSRSKELEIHLIYRDTNLLNKLSTFFLSCQLWFKKLHYSPTIVSKEITIPWIINHNKECLIITEQSFYDKNPDAFKTNKITNVILLNKHIS